MNKKIKIIFTLLVIFFMTGCSVKYNLEINEDSSINEEVIASENTKRLEKLTKLKGDQATNYLFNMFTRPNEDISFFTNIKNFDTFATASTVHNDLNEYSSRFSSDVFEKVEIINNDNLTTILAKQDKSLSKESSTSLLYDDIEVNITIPFIVEEHNADKVSKNKYTWNIKSDDELKTIKISYRDKEFSNEANIKINNKNYSFKYEYIVIASFIIIVILIILFVFRNNKKNNIV